MHEIYVFLNREVFIFLLFIGNSIPKLKLRVKNNRNSVLKAPPNLTLTVHVLILQFTTNLIMLWGPKIFKV